jgi:hypothetical protein
MPTPLPDYSQGKALLEEIVKGKSTRYQEELQRLEESAASRVIAEANTKAESEAKAKIAAEIKAMQDAKIKAAAKKRNTIICVKGKLKRIVTSVKPACPTGYKKK